MIGQYAIQAIGNDRWLCVDQLNGLSVEWTDKQYNETCKHKVVGAPQGIDPQEVATAIARNVRLMGRWLADNHRPKVEVMTDGGLIAWTREKIGRQVRELRKASGLSLSQLSEMCGLSANHINRVELGRYNYNIDTVAKITAALGGNIEI